MYNMEISIGLYKFRVEILVAIVIIFWIMFGHMLCGCCRVNIVENYINKKRRVDNQIGDLYNLPNTSREGFTSLSRSSMGPELGHAQQPGYIMSPSTWSMPTLTYSPGTTPSSGVKSIWDRPNQPIPPPEGQLSLFATTEFKPECCPNSYSTSTGCACMDVGTYNFLRERAGNNVPYSEY